jgi:hypothetical protein
MGGMVAQELALLLIPQRRLLSLTLSITCRGMQPIYGLLGPILTPQVGAGRLAVLGCVQDMSANACSSAAQHVC